MKSTTNGFGYIIFFTLLSVTAVLGKSLINRYFIPKKNSATPVAAHSEKIGPEKQSEKPETWITVFVHGIMGIKPHITPANIIRIILDRVHNTAYAKAVELMREDPFFFKYQAMQTLGLQNIDPTLVKPGYAVGAIAYIFDEISKMAHPSKEINNIFLTFGWSGLSSRSARQSAGVDLYHALEQKIKKLREDGIEPKVRVIGYSHGGNVVLNLGAAHPVDYQGHSFHVDQLVLLGTPVQYETDHFIQSHLFKNIYHLYSRADRVQGLDCFSYKRFFSHKLFKSRYDLELPNSLKQVQIRVTDTVKQKGSSQELRPVNAQHSTVIMGTAPYLRDRSPGHAELWSFGWREHGSNKRFPLHPLPIVTMVPYIIKCVESYDKEYTSEESIIVDLRPRYAHAIVRKKGDSGDSVLIPIVDLKKVAELGNTIEKYKPDMTNFEQLYKNHEKQACKTAQLFQLDKRRMERFKKFKKRKTVSLDQIVTA